MKDIQQKTHDLLHKLYEKQTYAEDGYLILRTAVLIGLNVMDQAFSDRKNVPEAVKSELKTFKKMLIKWDENQK